MTPLRLDRALIRVSGPDARAFLQGLVTQNLERLGEARLLYGALLSPQGKVSADMFFWDEADGAVLIDAAPARGAELMRRLAMYKLRAAVSLENESEVRAIWVSETPFPGALADPRRPELGFRGLAAGGEAGGEIWLRGRRLEAGVPDLAEDAAPEEIFALEALLEELHGVDFQKGCFIGQENVSRMKRRATTRRKFCPIAFAGPAPAPSTPIRSGEAELGTVRSGQDGRALALLRLDRALEAEAAGHALTAGNTAIRLAPPAWLILPSREPGAD